MKTLIVVPARYGSTRFPGKPLVEIAGRSMVSRVAVRARAAAKQLPDADYVVATDDARIRDHCQGLGLDVVLTPCDLPSGSDRALAAAETTGNIPDIIVNLQGDAPFTPLDYLTAIVRALATSRSDGATPVVQLDWPALEALRTQKKETPFSGTTALVGADGQALWFSKSILPALREEPAMCAASDMSPVYRHVGLYAYRRDALARFVALAPSRYEKLEGLEQLRLLENGMSLLCVPVRAPALSTSGIDTPEDVVRLEARLKAIGDPDAALW